RPAGYVNIDEDRDEVIRHRLGPENEGKFPKSFDAVIAEAENASDPDPSGRIAWLKRAANGANAFLDVNASDIMDGGSIANALHDVFKNRIVLIGGAFPDRDRHRTPLFNADGEMGSSKVHGVYLHAHVVAQLLDQRSIRDLPD